MNYFITAIDTNVGKTVFSAILAKALDYPYWKPIQCGDLDQSDSMKIKEWTNVKVYPEAFKLQQPMSPHEAARLSEIEVNLSDIDPPKANNLVIEGAGGIMVPLNYSGELVIDIAKKTNSEVILVIKNYLGSINHSLLSCEYLKLHKIPVKGLVVMGDTTPSSEKIISKKSGLDILYKVPYGNLNTHFIADQAMILKEKWNEIS
mgnify:FL=1|jgi:dethiobiotin synthetase